MTLKLIINEKFKLQCDKAMNGLEAVSIFRARLQNPYKVIFMDINMPIMDGHDAAIAINRMCDEERRPAPFIAALTAYNMREVH